MSRSERPGRPSAADGQIDVGLQFMLGLFLISAFIGVVWVIFGS